MDLYRAPRSQVIHQAREISPLAFSLPEGYLQGVQGQVGAHWPVGGLPPDDSPGVHVGHESHVDPPGERTHVGGGTSRLRGGGNGGDSQLIWPERAAIPFDKVGRAPLSRRAARGARGLGTSDTVHA